MKTYDLITIGATFLSLGAAQGCEGNCLVIDSNSIPGYEYIQPFYNGHIPDYTCKSRGGACFQEYIRHSGLDNPYFIPEWTAYISRWIDNNYAGADGYDVLLFTHVLKVQKSGDMYEVEIFNQQGKDTLMARHVMDTRCLNPEKKSIGFIVTGNLTLLQSALPDSMQVTYASDDISIIECEMPVECDSAFARKYIFEFWATRPAQLQDMKIVSIGDAFYEISSCGATEVCSSDFGDPVRAFDEGFLIGVGLSAGGTGSAEKGCELPDD